jgi:hypothetical protein
MKTARFEFVIYRSARQSAQVSKLYHECLSAINDADMVLFEAYSGDMSSIYRSVYAFNAELRDAQNGSRYYIDLKVELRVRDFRGKMLQYIAIEKHNGIEMYSDTYKGTKRLNANKPTVELLAEIIPNL